jgi:hypothetical protein
VPVVSRLLGHTNVQTTLRYAHLADKDIADTAERIGVAMARVMSNLPLGAAAGTGPASGCKVAKCWARSFGRVNSKDFHTWVLPR